jgi:hypothetical protein
MTTLKTYHLSQYFRISYIDYNNFKLTYEFFEKIWINIFILLITLDVTKYHYLLKIQLIYPVSCFLLSHSVIELTCENYLSSLPCARRKGLDLGEGPLESTHLQKKIINFFFCVMVGLGCISSGVIAWTKNFLSGFAA